MTEEITLAARLMLDAQNFVRGLGNAERKEAEFAQRSMERFRKVGEGMMRGLGIDLVAMKLGMETFEKIKESALRDKSMMRLGQTAKLTSTELSGVRTQLWKMARETGTGMDELVGQLGAMVGNGMRDMKEALPALDAVNKAMAVTAASGETLQSALEVASKQFNFDLSKPKEALRVMNELAAASGAGHGYGTTDLLGATLASPESVNAKTAGLNFKENAAFLGQMAKNDPEKLTLNANALLQVFQNAKRMMAVQKHTGVKFFVGKDQHRADVLDVFSDIQHHLDKLKKEKAKEAFFEKVFKGTSLKAMAGVRSFFESGSGNVAQMVSNAKTNNDGFITGRLPDALNNMADQGLRLNMAFAELTDKVGMKVNRQLANGIEYLINDKNHGGLGLDGTDMVKDGAALGIGALLAKKLGGGILTKLVSQPEEIIKAKVLEQVAGITPVYVTNWPGGALPSSSSDPVSVIGKDVAAGAGGATGLSWFARMRAGVGFAGLASIPTALGLAGGTAASAGIMKAVNPNLTNSQLTNLMTMPFSKDALNSVHADLAKKDAWRMDRSGQDLRAQIFQTMMHAQKQLDGVKQTAEEKKAELHVTIDSNGNARVSGVTPGSAFSHIETTVRNMARDGVMATAGRMMTSL